MDYNLNTENTPNIRGDPAALLFSYLVKYEEPPPAPKARILEQILTILNTER
ncbi:MAG: hypothetical protein IJJ50_07585 [Lachnospiraceae bacterium]|nr:hypothetical protein [Lachnospiraceae bacterium]